MFAFGSRVLFSFAWLNFAKQKQVQTFFFFNVFVLFFCCSVMGGVFCSSSMKVFTRNSHESCCQWNNIKKLQTQQTLCRPLCKHFNTMTRFYASGLEFGHFHFPFDFTYVFCTVSGNENNVFK